MKKVTIVCDGSSLGNGRGITRAAAVAVLGFKGIWKAVGEYLDLKKFLTSLAVESYLALGKSASLDWLIARTIFSIGAASGSFSCVSGLNGHGE